jgi:hypothetical protein
LSARQALQNTPAHGKLLVDIDLFPRAFATNTAEQFLFEVDLVAQVNKAAYPFSDLIANKSQCTGTHYIAYSSINKQWVAVG